MPDRAASSLQDRALVLGGVVLLIALTFVAYWPAVNAAFIWDDDMYVAGNLLLRDADGLRRIWIPRQTPQYYPAVFSTFWLEYQLWGTNPKGYHFVNIALHALNALLVWRLWVALRLPGGTMAGWLAAAVFAVHPVHVESVAWITERKNVLSGFFYLAAALAYLRFDGPSPSLEGGGKGVGGTPAARRTSPGDSVHPTHPPAPSLAGRGRWPWYILSFILFILALFSKTVTCSLPAALILMMLWRRKPITVRRLAPLIPMFVAGLILGLNTAQLEKDHVLAVGPEFDFSLAERLLIASKALLFYPMKLLWPPPLIFVYPRWTIDAGHIVAYWPVVIVLGAAIAAIAMYRRGFRGPPLALAFFAGTIFPALGFFNIYPMLFSFVADHFVYLASLGIIALVVGIIAARLDDSRRLAAVGLIVLPLLMSLTSRQASVYRNLETLWRDTIRKNPDAWMAHTNLAPILVLQSYIHRDNKHPERADALVREAREHAQRAVDLKPTHVPALVTLSETLREEGRYEQAIPPLLRAIELHPPQWTVSKMPDYRFQLGRLHELLGRSFESTEAYGEAVRLEPNSILFRSSLLKMLIRRGERMETQLQLDELEKSAADESLPRAAIDAQAMQTVVAAYLAAGMPEQAQRAGQAGIALARRLNRPDLAQAIEQRLESAVPTSAPENDSGGGGGGGGGQ